ncbi:hypothetical protein JWG39_06625 [Desulforhopalus vacuolatus]|uniref:hypothetical protein n=1 Tax=Desulforhopalus vacuolatus TaxID=40414 RepID=UPI001964959E|nr:hypothetical protein [Desulforhopalus vacuolatus]MBM9519494.1 hypothetical protein [Desulforhopalus vacuolatus]
MTDKTQEELETKIARLEQYLVKLKAELEKTRLREQHEAIEQIDQYLHEDDNLTSDLEEFWGVLVSDMREFFDHRKKRSQHRH